MRYPAWDTTEAMMIALEDSKRCILIFVQDLSTDCTKSLILWIRL